MAFTQLKVDYKIPERVQKSIDALQEGVEAGKLYVDCLQDELKADIHGETYEDGLTEEQAEELLDYYYRRRW